MQADLEYINTGMFTRFLANTKAGEQAYNDMHNQNNGSTAVLSIHTKDVIAQLRKAGYSVAKAKKPTQTIEDILAELEA